MAERLTVDGVSVLRHHTSGMRKTLKGFLKNHFPADGLGWKIPSFVAATIAIVSGAVALIVWARHSLSAFFTADLEVWHLLLAVGALIFGGLIVIIRRRGSDSARPRVDRTRYAPKEIEKYGVLWPITVRWFDQPEFRAGKPQCQCRTSLGLDCGDGEVPIQLPDDGWKDVPSTGMTLRCPKDDLAYDLTGYNTGMFLLVRNVEAEASGRYSTALREAGL